MTDDLDRPMKRQTKRVFNRATGKFQKQAGKVRPGGATQWWKEKLGFGGKKGEGALAKRRKKVIDDNVKKGGG